MANEVTPIKQISALMNGNAVKAKFTEMLGKKAPQFISSVMSVVNNNALLQKASPQSIYGAAIMGAALDLPINQNLGFAYIVPFKNDAQFQLGYKGYVQLAMRSGQYQKINVIDIKEGQLEVVNPITEEYKFNTPTSDKIVGYMAYFKLNNGFEKFLYMTVEDIQKHANTYSQTARKGFGVWKDNFHAMAEKTVLKRLLSKYGILSIEMQQAIKWDQGVVKKEESDSTDISDNEIVYVDNQKMSASDLAELAEEVEDERQAE